MKLVSALLCLLFLGSALALKRHWIEDGRADPEEIVSVRFALTQFNLDVLERNLLDISNPRSVNYGKWWTAEALTELIAPPKMVSQLVTNYLKAQGATTVEDRRDSIKFDAPVRIVEELLQTTLSSYHHAVQTSKTIIRASEDYSIPTEIADHVDFVAGLLEFPTFNKLNTADIDAAGVDGYIVPFVINDLYQIPSGIKINRTSSIALAEFQNDNGYAESDLKTFAKGTDTKVVVSHIVGPKPTGGDLESSLDVEYGAAISQGTTVWFWTVSGWMYEFVTEVLNTPNPPLVISMSWGWPEPWQCNISSVANCTDSETSEQYINRVNTEFKVLGSMGITLLAASGDQGAPGDENPGCTVNGSSVLSAIFPGASPWVLSVGATMLTNTTKPPSGKLPPICTNNGITCANPNSTTELVCTYPKALITTGGGFSYYSPMPEYQQAVVTKYLNSGVPLPPSNAFNQSNRGFPDVSALGHMYLISDAAYGGWLQVDGTSCSTPVFGAIIALLNSYRLNANKPSLGFVAPLIYQAYDKDATTFTDITTGNNKCTESCCGDGYEATVGWDPVTGLGTPNFPKLLKFVEALP